MVPSLAALPVRVCLDAADHVPLPHVVVVTGPHRSGTTLFGRLLLHAPRTFLVHEPFNLDWGLAGVPHRYPYLPAAEADSPAELILHRYLTHGEGRWMGHGTPLAETHERMRANRQRVRALRPLGFTAIVKDPFLLLALERINASLSDRPPVVTLRHPCAWVASLQRRSMHPRTALESFRAQGGFGNPVVTEILNQQPWETADLIPAAAATWTCLVRMLDVQLDAGARATVVRMEDFAADPLTVLLDVLHASGLRIPRGPQQIVDDYTGAHNAVQPRGNVMHALRRNSSALVSAWRTQLTEADQKTVRQISEPVATRWYDWW